MQTSSNNTWSGSRFKKSRSGARNVMTEHETVLFKLLPILLIASTTAVSVALIIIKEHRWTGNFYTLVTDNRDTVGLIVNVIASILGAAQVFALTTAINYAFRLRFQHGKSTNLRFLRFWISIVNASVHAVRASLPLAFTTVVLAFFILLRLPTALWAGGLTPTETDFQEVRGSILVPTYPAEDLYRWQGSFRKDENSTVSMVLNCNWTIVNITMIQQSNFANTMISTCPSVDQAGGMIGNLATASRLDPRLHPRIDNAGWNYKGRSYGVGASPGIMKIAGLAATKAPIQWISYNESGYDTQVTCQKNTSSAYRIVQGLTSKDTNTVRPAWTKLYEVTGTLPNSLPGVVEYYGLVSKSPLNDANNSFGWSALSNNNTNMIAVAGTGHHVSFDQLICTVTFMPTTFNVYINATDATINVSRSAVPTADIEPTGQYAKAVFYSLEQLARMSSVTVTSSLGHPLTQTFNDLTNGARYNARTMVPQATQAMADGIISLMDDLFVANAHSQLVIANHSTSVPLTVNYKAVELGSDGYLYAILVTNAVVLVIVLIETARTRFWHGLSTFDFTDVPDMAIASSVGGKSIAFACGRESSTRPAHRRSPYSFGPTTAGSDDHFVHDNAPMSIERDAGVDEELVRVRLRKEVKGYALVSTEDQAEEVEFTGRARDGKGLESHGLVDVRTAGAREGEGWRSDSDHEREGEGEGEGEEFSDIV